MLERTDWGQEIFELSEYLEGGIYFLYQDASLVYIGTTANLFQRIGQHLAAKTFSFNRVGVMLEDDPKERTAVEAMLINKYRPKYNKLLNGALFGDTKGRRRRSKARFYQETTIIDNDFDDLDL